MPLTIRDLLVALPPIRASDAPTPQPSDTPVRPPHQIPIEEPDDDTLDPNLDPTIGDPRPPNDDAPIRLPPGATARRNRLHAERTTP